MIFIKFSLFKSNYRWLLLLKKEYQHYMIYTLINYKQIIKELNILQQSKRCIFPKF